jgi:hypothetical protein
MFSLEKKTVLIYETIGMLFIIMLGSLFHFTYEWSGYQPIVGVFSAVNESVWEHLKLAFWPSLLYVIVEYRLIKKETNNFFLAKTFGIYVMPIVITATFYSYTAITGESIFLIDILSFILAVIIGQLASYKLLTYKQFSDKYEKISLTALFLLGVAFIIFTFYPPHLPIFQDPISGDYGIVHHSH